MQIVTEASRLHNAERTFFCRTEHRETASQTAKLEALTTVAFSRSSSKKAKSCNASF